MQGQKTAAFEIIENLGNAPDWLCIPMGNAGNISAYWMGFEEYFKAKKSRKLPRMMGFKKCSQALIDKDYVLASEELLDSKMGKSDVRGLVNRITELSARMRDV